MSRSRPQRVRLGELEPGQFADFFALLSERTRGQTREGKPFFTCRFRDRTRIATAMIWSDGPHFAACETDWQVGHFFKIRGSFSDHERYGPQLDIQQIRAVVESDRSEGFDPAELIEHSRFDADAMFADLRQIAEQLEGETLRQVVLHLLDTHAGTLKRLPASPRHYYPFAGGWLEHTLSVTRTCQLLVDRYREHFPDATPPLNRDLVLAAAMLHNLGRVAELDPADPVNGATIPGRLLGHLFLGRDLFRDAAMSHDLDAETRFLLEHLLITHLNLPEWGSPRLPLMPEALILFHAIDLDAKLEMYLRCLARDTSTGPFTERDPILGRQLLKERTQ